MKNCKCCKTDKLETEFYAHYTNQDGLRSTCKACSKDKSVEEWKTKRRVTKGCSRENQKYEHKNDYRRNYRMKKEYGITLEIYNQLFAAQEGCCNICGKHQSQLTKRLAVDHNHQTGAVRGLLCSPCNAALGGFGDNEDILLKAIQHLRGGHDH